MLRTPVGFLALVALLAACGDKGGDTAPLVQNLDTRIDQAPEGSDPDSFGAQMCVNELGEIFVVWIDDRDGTDDVWFNASTDLGVSWFPAATKLNRGLNNSVWNAAIACNDKGVYVVWEDDRDGELQNHNIYFNRSTDAGQSWLENDVLLEDDEDGHSFSQGPQIASAGNDLYVVYYDQLNGAPDILCAASGDNGKTWRTPVRVDADEPAGSAFSGSPHVTATEAGNVYVVWEDTRDGKSDVYFNRSTNAANSFETTDSRLDGGDEAGANFSFSPQISADGDDIYVVWHDARNSNAGPRDVYLNYSSNGGANWSNTATLVNSSRIGFYNNIFPKVATVGSKGVVAWYDNRDTGYDVYARVFDKGEPGVEEVRLDSGDEPGYANSTKVAVATNGTEVAVAWEDERDDVAADNGYDDLYYNFGVDGAWQEEDLRVDTFYPANSYKTDLNIAVHGQLLFATWTDGRLGTADVFFKKLTLGEAGETLEGEQAPAGG